MLKITDAEKKALKGRGYLLTNDGEHFAARVVTVGGVMDGTQIRKIAEAAGRYGDGRVAMTTRLTVEVQGLSYENIEPFDQFLREGGLYTGGTGPRVRPIVACKGTVCVHGLADTQQLARDLHKTFYEGWHEVKLPHKFKIGIGGCPNNCIKPDLNDFGIIGQKMPKYAAADCAGCKKCPIVENCPVKAAHKDENGVMQIDRTVCSNCGKCVGACNFNCVTAERQGYRITVGGYWGKRRHLGIPVDGIYTREELFKLIEKSLLLYREQGEPGERFGMYIERIGADSFIRQLLSGLPEHADAPERK